MERSCLYLYLYFIFIFYTPGENLKKKINLIKNYKKEKKVSKSIIKLLLLFICLFHSLSTFNYFYLRSIFFSNLMFLKEKGVLTR